MGASASQTGLLPFGLDPAVPAVPAAIPCASAIISGCGRYRYRLERGGYGLGKTAIIMVNPSTADAENDDATIRKLRGFGKRNAWGDLIVGNLFAYRATDVLIKAGALIVAEIERLDRSAK